MRSLVGFNWVRTALVISLVCVSIAKAGQANAGPKVQYDGFVDTYYAYDFNGPTNLDRAFTTQPARSDEFNLNLVSIGASFEEDQVRGRVALQTGTSVHSNYSAEPKVGTVSGPNLSQFIQEAYVGYVFNPDLSLDAGIFLSHLGGETFISRDNATYTRSLVADFSPYYQSGIRLTYKPSNTWQYQLHVLNGWQIISENNHSKSVGAQVMYSPTPTFSIAYNNLVGRESEFRHFHDLVLKYQLNPSFSFLAQYDLGFQRRPNGEPSFSQWNGVTLIGQYRMNDSRSFALRAEQFIDHDQVIVSTLTPSGFSVQSASIGYDQKLSGTVTWRSELRQFWSSDEIYPSGTSKASKSTLFVTSLSASF